MSDTPDITSNLIFRSGSMADWPTVAEIVAETWEFGDYIDEALWQEWVADSEGHVVVVTLDSQVVGFSRLGLLSPAEWWMEGGRVAPALRGRGIGQAMTDYLLAFFRKHCHGLLRAATYNKNEAAIKLIKGAGFRHVISYSKVEAGACLADIGNFRRLKPANQSMAFQYLRNSPMYRANHFVEREWVLYYLTEDRLGKYLADPQVQVLGWRTQNVLRGVEIIFTGPPRRARTDTSMLNIGFLDAPDDTTVLAMLEATRGLAAKYEYEKIAWKMPTGVGLERSFLGVDIERVWEDDGALWLFELPIQRL